MPSVNHYETKKSRSGTSAKADLKRPETILLTNWANKFEEAYNICKNFPIKEITFNNDKFYYAALVAQLCDRLNMKEEVKDFAKIAIEFSKITETQFNRHKTVGLVKATDKRLRILEQIANEIESSP